MASKITRGRSVLYRHNRTSAHHRNEKNRPPQYFLQIKRKNRRDYSMSPPHHPPYDSVSHGSFESKAGRGSQPHGVPNTKMMVKSASVRKKKRERETRRVRNGGRGLARVGKKKEVMDVSRGGEGHAPFIEARGEVRVGWEPARVRRGKTVRCCDR